MRPITTSPATGGTSGTASDALIREHRETIQKLKEKEAALEARLERDPGSFQLQYDLELVKEMLRDTQAAVRQMRPKNHRRHRRTRWISLDGQSWQWMEKMSWDRLESFEHDRRVQREWMKAVLDDGTTQMTIRQRQVFELVYKRGFSQKAVADLLAVDASTVHKTLFRAVEKLKRYAEGRELVRTCTRPDGSMDLRRVVAETALLTDRQRQVLQLTLEGKNSQQTADRLGVCRSTAHLTLKRGERRLKTLTKYLSGPEIRAIRDRRIRREALDWRVSCKELADKYKVSLSVIYHLTAGSRRWDGMTALQREVWARRQEGQRPKDIARDLGMDVRNVYQAQTRAKRAKECTDMTNSSFSQRGGAFRFLVGRIAQFFSGLWGWRHER